MSSSSTPTSAGSYTEAEMVAKLGVAADCFDYFKVKQISELLRSKDVKPRGKKAQKCKQVALVCTADEVQAFRAGRRRKRRRWRHWPRRRRRSASQGS